MVNVKALVSKRKFTKARTWYLEAGICKIRASFILNEFSKQPIDDFHGVLEALQHCYELCVKVLFLITGHSAPKNHEPAIGIDKVTRRFYRIFPDWESKDEFSSIIDWIKSNEKDMAELHETTIYGNNSKPASQLFTLDYVLEVFNKVNFLWEMVRGPLLFIGHELNVLKEDEEKYLHELFELKKIMNSDPELESYERKRLKDFLDRTRAHPDRISGVKKKRP